MSFGQLPYDLAHLLGGAVLLLSFVLLYQRRISAVINAFATQGALLRRWLEERVLPAFDERILPIDLQVARRCARLRIPDRRAERDALIGFRRESSARREGASPCAGSAASCD
jgi:hypothetical protein